MKKNEIYPRYIKTKECLYCFLSRDKMYKIEMRGSNMNTGLTIDAYITRNMVIKHQKNSGDILTADEFEKLVRRLYEAILSKMI